MASNEYYNSKPLPQPTPSPQPYYSRSYGGGQSSTYEPSIPPPYSPQPHHPVAANHPPRPVSPLNAPTPSPFDTPFDDHVYPASSHQTPSSSRQQLSQQDTDYHGLSRVPSDEMAYNHPTDDIPLQNRPKDLDGNDIDHVYEAPRRRKSKKAVRFGELGMLGSNTKRIPWVVYIFTVAQIGVFIGEIVKNGKPQYALNDPLNDCKS